MIIKQRGQKTIRFVKYVFPTSPIFRFEIYNGNKMQVAL